MRSLISSAYGRRSAESYDRKRFTTTSGILFDQLEKEVLNEAISKVSLGSLILEVGAGTGRFSIHLEKQEYQTHLIDLSWSMLQICKGKFDTEQIEFRGYQCSSTHLLFRSRSFDFVFAIRLLNQLPSVEAELQTIREMIRVCKTGGYVLFEFVNYNGLSRIGKKNTTFLSMRAIRHLINLISAVSIESKKGVLFFSQTTLDKIPTMKLKQIFLKVDKFFCSFAPLHATRCYILLKKHRNHINLQSRNFSKIAI